MDRLTPQQESYIDEARRASQRPAPPPTIADLQAEGVIGFHLCCGGHVDGKRCGHWRLITWDEVRLDPLLPFPEICWRIKARCTKCGGQSFHVVPDASHRKMPGW